VRSEGGISLPRNTTPRSRELQSAGAKMVVTISVKRVAVRRCHGSDYGKGGAAFSEYSSPLGANGSCEASIALCLGMMPLQISNVGEEWLELLAVAPQRASFHGG